MPDLKVLKELKVGAHISGGGEGHVGSEHFVLPPVAAVSFGEALLKASGYDVRFAGGQVLVGAAPVIFNQ